MSFTRAQSDKQFEELKDFVERLKAKVNDIDVPEMAAGEIKKKKKWLDENWKVYKSMYEAVCQTPYKNDPELAVVNSSAEEFCQTMHTALEEFSKIKKGLGIFKKGTAADNGVMAGGSGKSSQEEKDVGKVELLKTSNKQYEAETNDQANMFQKLKRGYQMKVSSFDARIVKLEERLHHNRDITGLSDFLWPEVQRCYNQLEAAYQRLGEEDLIDDLIYTSQEEVNARYEEIGLKVAELKGDNKNNVPYNMTRLEELKIPSFYGNISEWNSFKEIFMKLVGEDKRQSRVEKFYRLKSVVKGEAARLIQHLQVTDNNYEAAWTLLEQRYNNRRLLFCTLFDKIIEYPNISIQSAANIKGLLDAARESLHALEAMGISLDGADPFLARLLIRKLDKEGLLRYEQCIQKTKEIQVIEDVMAFLEQQYLALESVNAKREEPTSHGSKTAHMWQETKKTCEYCDTTSHGILKCWKFSKLSAAERVSWAQERNQCMVCLLHKANKRCPKFYVKCEKCNKKHHTMLHIMENTTTRQEIRRENSRAQLIKENNAITLLATAQVNVKSACGESILMRALIDQGSQRTSISEEAAQMLRLPRRKLVTELVGLGDTAVGVSKAVVNIQLKPRFQSDVTHVVDAMVLPTLSSAQPDRNIDVDVTKWKNYCLADPLFYKSDRIDLLIGADLYPEIIQSGIVKIDSLAGQETSLGLILCGLVGGKSSRNITMAVTKELERFWEMEEIVEDENTKDDVCEELFAKTTKLNEENRFVVRLPFKQEFELGESRNVAMARMLQLEKRLARDGNLKREYEAFMSEYLKMGHMRKAEEAVKGAYYIPHQAVVRECSTTTKVRVVFDASTKTSNGKSLNEVLESGPKLQRDIFQILIKWRLWKYVLVADVEKMYRQVLIAEEDLPYQTILWRENFRGPIEEYVLTTVTYGMNCAPFLAKRALLEIANDCHVRNPKLYEIIKDDFYMDDLMTGADGVDECIKIQKNITAQLRKFGFKLRKWMSNDKHVLDEIPDAGDSYIVKIEEGETMKTLGIQWDPRTDNFAFYFQINDKVPLTKRRVLSTLAKIYDPLGWLAPVTILAKLFIQKLWLMDMQWDTKLDEKTTKEWKAIVTTLSAIGNVRIPRWLSTFSSMEIELHGFADASEKAFAAVVYVKTSACVTILAAKSKVNPIKNRKTLPKLELCAAHLLAKLLDSVIQLLHQNTKIYAWSDSTIALSWISDAGKVKDKFIRSRVNDIQKAIPSATWKHVRSNDNPADAASRGLKPEQLVAHELWWNGPSWLYDESLWPVVKKSSFAGATREVVVQNTVIRNLINRISGYRKLIRVMAYVNKFTKKVRKMSTPNYFSVKDLEEAERIIIKTMQEELFGYEIRCLKQGRELPTKSKICGLNPFLDHYGVLRVGGRLENAHISYERKHPMLMAKCDLVGQIVDDVHTITLHGGVKMMESVLRGKFWVIGAKNIIKKKIRCCVKCIRYRRETTNQLMGNLPASRVSPSFPFEHTGIDYAGPVQMKISRGRGQRSYKGYIAIFVCMATKAIHLEAVSDLTTEAFLAALRRFFSRRGKSSHIYSDNGTNFVGAARKLDEDYNLALQQNAALAEELSAEKIQWHFIPPGAPHFGGLWEAAVKSMKHHLRRVIGEGKLTYEEMSTLLAQIEAVLNSRPLYEISEESNTILTPGHFLIGRSFCDAPESNDGTKLGSLDRWKIIQKMRADFWRQWRNDYLTSLQQRTKWKTSSVNVKVGQLVILKEENTAPAKWPLAKIIEVHKGVDEKVRVVTLKTKNGSLKRPVHKLCPLNVVHEEDDMDGLCDDMPVQSINEDHVNTTNGNNGLFSHHEPHRKK